MPISWRPHCRRGYEFGARAGNSRRWRHAACLERPDRPDHRSAVRIPRGGCARDQLSLAALKLAVAGVRLRRHRLDPNSLSRGGGARVPLLQLRGRYADSVAAVATDASPPTYECYEQPDLRSAG